MPIQAVNAKEPIAGYKVRERIGAGGYGEVWKADAPGGLEKAIKFVYGYLDEDRAARELKALNRIKEVRHPFLLSLERIEVVDGQLLIVTELAESSLKDRFDECRSQGLEGIPRDELLVYIRDAADALDFMSDHHSLQHLDVKPENLLLVGGRVKVADFGLVKHLHDATASLMGGLTPLYAPPEVFDGRPSLHSDQYSLAIVYQEMLTGVLPFPGTSAAQLASQHLHAKPRISSLPPEDQPGVAVALAKDPNDRFDTCGELIDSLTASIEGVEPEVQQQPTTSNAREATHSNAATAAFTSVRASLSKKQPGGTLIPSVESPSEVRNGPRIELSPEEVCLRPTVIVGIGGTAASILTKLVKRLHDRLGDRKSIAALQMLLVDTNNRALMQATQGENGESLSPDEVLALPLRRPKDYRSRSKKLGKSTSRRWLYNIPKSLQTEGLRPLGRLAWLDHYEELAARLHQCISKVLDPTAIQSSCESTGLNVRSERPHVVVVGSISGGTGGGMLIDTAFMIRNIFNELEIPDADICGMLTHATGRNPTANDLAIANAYACLCELQHYGRPDRRYPGELACGLPPFEHEQTPFDSTYLLHFGDEITEHQFDIRSDQLAEYLYQDSVTAAASLLENSRSDQQGDAGSQLRSFGVYQVGMSQDEFLNNASAMLGQGLVQLWLGENSDDDPRASGSLGTTCSLSLARTRKPEEVDSINEEAKALLERLGIRCEVIVEKVQEILQQHVGTDLHRQLEALLENVAESSDSARPHQDVLQGIDIALGFRDEDGDARDATVTALPLEVTYHVDQLAARLATETTIWLTRLLDESNHHLRGARQAAKWLESITDSLRTETIQIEKKIAHDLTQLHAQIVQFDIPEQKSGKTKKQRGPNQPPSVTPESQMQLLQYLNLGVHRLALRGARKVVLTIRSEIANLSEQLRDLWRELHRVSAELDTSEAQQPHLPRDDSARDPTEILTERLQGRLRELAGQLDHQLRENSSNDDLTLTSLLTAEASTFQSLSNVLQDAARKLIMTSQSGDDVLELLLPKNVEPEVALAQLKESVELANPHLLDCGGLKQVMLVVPKGVNAEALQLIIEKGMGESVSVAQNNVSDVVLCCELQQLSLAQVAVKLIDNRRDYAEVAARLYSRSDVTWRPWG